MRRIALLCAVLCLCTTAAVAWGHSISVRPAASHVSRTAHVNRHPRNRGSQHKSHPAKQSGTKASSKKTSSKKATSKRATASKAALTTASSVLFGDQTLESSADNNSAGLGEAFPFSGHVNGTARSINVYVDSRSTAKTVLAAIYADRSGHPGALLASDTLSSPKAGAWNTLPISATTVSSSKSYWIAVLGKGGKMVFRDRASGPCESVGSSQTSLASMPSAWSTGEQWSTCPVSAYVSGTAAAVISSPPPPATTTPSTTTPSTTTVTTAPVAPPVTSTTTSTPAPLPPLPPLPVAPLPLQAPQISGTAMDGQTLTTDNGAWLDGPTSCTNIAGATGSSYTLTRNDVNDTVRVVVTASNTGGSTPSTSSQTGVVQPMPVPTNTAAPSISGTTTQGQTLTLANGTWTGNPSSYGDQWQDCDSAGASCANISGARSGTYTLTSSDVGHTIRVVVTASNDGGSTPATSAQTAAVQAPPAPTNTALPTISGTTTQGQALTASKGTWNGSPTSYSYQWRDCNSSGSACSNISGATSSSYTLTTNDVGNTVRVVVTATNVGGSTPATSAQTAAVQAPAAQGPTNTALPTVSGAATQGQTLTATSGSWTGTPTGYGYQWADCNSSGASCTNISGAISNSYTLTSTDVGNTVRVAVTATNSGGSASRSRRRVVPRRRRPARSRRTSTPAPARQLLGRRSPSPPAPGLTIRPPTPTSGRTAPPPPLSPRPPGTARTSARAAPRAATPSRRAMSVNPSR
jgi:hypothetical protein